MTDNVSHQNFWNSIWLLTWLRELPEQSENQQSHAWHGLELLKYKKTQKCTFSHPYFHCCLLAFTLKTGKWRKRRNLIAWFLFFFFFPPSDVRISFWTQVLYKIYSTQFTPPTTNSEVLLSFGVCCSKDGLCSSDRVAILVSHSAFQRVVCSPDPEPQKHAT